MKLCLLKFQVGLVILLSVVAANVVAGTDELPAGKIFPQVFSDQSPWNMQISESPSIDPMSQNMIANLRWLLEYSDINPSIGIAYDKWTSPIHIVDFDSARKVNVFNRTYSWFSGRAPFFHTVDPDGDGVAKNIPIPAGLWADSEEDGHMIIVDINKKQAYEFSKFSYSWGSYKASRVDFWDLTERGVREVSGLNLGENYWMSGVRGAGSPFIAGIVRYDEMQAGVINHALSFAGLSTRKGNDSSGLEREFCGYSSLTEGQVGVASRSDGLWGVDGPVEDGLVSARNDQWIEGASIMEGQRIMLKQDINVEAMPVSEHAKIILRALQTYGGYMVDNANGFQMYFENLGDETWKWSAFSGVLDISSLALEDLDILTCENIVYFDE